MAQTLSVTEVARHFADYINRVSYRGECFVLMRGNNLWRNSAHFLRGNGLWNSPHYWRPLPHLSPAEATQLAGDLTAAVRCPLARRSKIRCGLDRCPVS